MTRRLWREGSNFFAQADFSVLLRTVERRGGCDLVLTSPPYDDARTYGNAVSWKFEDYQRLGDAIFGALKPGGHCLMVLDGPVRERRKGIGTERSTTPFRVLLDWADRVGFRFVERIAYGRLGAPGAYAGRFRNDWEPLLWFQRPGAKGYFDKWTLTESSKWKPAGASGTWRPDGSRVKRVPSGRAVEGGLKHRGTFWDHGSVGFGHEDPRALATNHPARFSLRLAEDVVLCYSPLGGLVVDPMVGSGTTAVASVRHGRTFAGSDAFANDEGKPWAEVARDRVAAEVASVQSPGASG